MDNKYSKMLCDVCRKTVNYRFTQELDGFKSIFLQINLTLETLNRVAMIKIILCFCNISFLLTFYFDTLVLIFLIDETRNCILC